MLKKLLKYAIFASFALLVFVGGAAKAQATCDATATGTWDGSSGGTANFTGCAGSAATGTGTGARPAAGDTVIVDSGAVLTVSANATVGGITLASPTASNGLTINTGVTVTDGGVLSYTANATGNPQTLTLAGTGVLNVAGTGTVNAPTGAGNSLVTCSGAGSLTFGGTLTINGNSTSTGKSSFGMGACTLSAPGINLVGGSNATGVAEITASTGTIITTAAGITFSGTPANTDITTTGAATINNTGPISGAGVLSLTAGTLLQTHGTSAINTAYTTWKNMEVVDGTTTLGAVQTVTGLQVDNGATLTQSTFLLTDTGTGTGLNGFTINGTVGGTGGQALTGTGMTIDGIGTVAGTSTWTNAKTIASTSNITFSGTIALAASTTVTSNGSLATTAAGGITGTDGTSVWTQASGSSLYFSGATTSLLSTGVLNANAFNNLVNYNLGGAQTVKVPASSYYDLSFSGSGIKTIGATLTVSDRINIGSGLSPVVLTNSSATTTNRLIVAGAVKQKGTYGSSGSAATYKNDGSFASASSGIITAAVGPSTSNWATPASTSTSSTSSSSSSSSSGASTYVDTSSSSNTSTTTPANSTATSVAASTPGLVITQVLNPVIISGCDGRDTGFSTTLAGQSCVGNTILTTNTSATTSMQYNFGTATLKNGSKGDAVKQLQMFLNATLNMSLTLDGKLGPKTIAVIKTWQKAHGLVADGLIGAKTKAMMNTSVSGSVMAQ